MRDTIIRRAAQLSHALRSPRIRPMHVFSPHPSCCRGLDYPVPDIQDDVTAPLKTSHVDVVLNGTPPLDEWVQLLQEDLRLMGYEIAVRRVSQVMCQGVRGMMFLVGEPCGKGSLITCSVL